MDLTKSKKRKISDFFAPMPTKVTRYQRHTKTTDIKTTEEPSPIPLRKNVSPVNQESNFGVNQGDHLFRFLLHKRQPQK